MVNPYEREWVAVFCPVCNKRLGRKKKEEIDSFICETEGCSKTKHTFFPGEIKRPGKSVPWFSYHDTRNKCGKPCCDPTSLD